MKIDLSGKLALVTGSAAGIGLATAKGLAGTGAAVIVNSRHEGSVRAAEAAVREAVPGAQVHGFVGDLSNAAGCEAIVKAYPKVDVLVNNLGVFAQQDFFEIPDSEWLRFFETNVMSGVRLSRAYAGAMVKQGWGRIVFISSESGLNIPPDMLHYGMTKTAQIAVARGLAKRLAGTGVTVNSVLPGPTLSEGVEAMLKDEVEKTGKPVEEVAAAFVQQHRASSIIRRAANVEEVANMVVYACSKQASATTGAALRVDGGVVDTIA